MPLLLRLTKFAEAFSKSPNSTGSVTISPSPLSFSTPLHLGAQLSKYYSTLRIRDRAEIGGQFHLRLFSPEELETAQEGRRWGRDKSGKRISNPLWNNDCVVIADRNGDPLSVDTSDDSVWANIQAKRLFSNIPIN